MSYLLGSKMIPEERGEETVDLQGVILLLLIPFRLKMNIQ